MSRPSIVDAERLIEQVKKRPGLYDSSQGPTPPDVKRAIWEEIAKEMYTQVWNASDQNEKDALVKVIQIRWRSLRDSFFRGRRLAKSYNRKVYIYDRHLAFLDKFRTSDEQNDASNSPNQVDTNNEDSMELDPFGEQIIYPANTNNDNSTSSVKEEFIVDNSSSGVQAHQALPTTPSLQDQNRERKIENLLEKLVEIQKEQHEDDKMGNKKFLLSLLPFMTKLADDVNLELRLQLLNVVQTYVSEGAASSTN